MKSSSIRYLTLFILLVLLLTLGLVSACAQPKPSPPPTPPKPPPTQPTTTSENQTPQEAPPANEATNEEKWYTIDTFSGKGAGTIPPFRVYGTEWRITWTIDTEYPESAALDIIVYFRPSGSIWKTATFKGSSSGDIIYPVENRDNRDFSLNVTARSLSGWTITLEDNAPPIISSPIKITYIHYNGTVFPPDKTTCCCYERVEPDEYVVIKNLSENPVTMGGWVLKNISKPSPSFTFPSHFIAEPGQIMRVYTDEYHYETGGFSFYYIQGDIWSNDEPNIAVLYDAQGYEISRKSYAVSATNETSKRTIEHIGTR